MYSYKKPEAEVRLRYPKYVELGLLISLLVLTVIFLFSKRFEIEGEAKKPPPDSLIVEEIPITQQVKRPPPPARPSIPVEDPEVDIEDDIAFEDIDEIDWSVEAPPPPPSIEEEVVDFFAVESPPQMQGGSQALYEYMSKNEMYPDMARQAGIEGDVIVQFIVGADGKPKDVTVAQERPQGLGFGEVATKAILAMEFKPGYQRDKPVAVRMQQVIRFRLQ
ncbi:TonB family protein [bacterium]|nr:TonB family protein [bacterium]